MTDAELRGRLLQFVYDFVHKNGGYVSISAEAFAGDEQIDEDRLRNVAEYLAQIGFIENEGVVGGPVVGHAKITALGINAIELPNTRPANIIVPERPSPVTHQLKAETGSYSTARQERPVVHNANSNVSGIPFFMNQNADADMAAVRAAELARRTIAGQAWNNSGYVPRPPEDIAKDQRIAAMTASILSRPLEVETSVRRVSKEARAFIKEMSAEIPNDAASLRRFNDVTTFLENSAKQLDEIADAVHGVSEASPDTASTRILAGKTAEAFDWLGGQVNTWLENNPGKLPGKLMKASFIIGGACLLHALNLDFIISAGILKIMLDDFTDTKPKKD